MKMIRGLGEFIYLAALTCFYIVAAIYIFSWVVVKNLLDRDSRR